MEKISFEIETITPMFLAGADQTKAELRAASIKGLLRFWWRALQAEPDLDKLRNRESEIFGSSDEKKGGGSSFSLRIQYDTPPQSTKDRSPFNKSHYQVPVEGKTFKTNILDYLAYGTYEYIQRQGNVFTRDYIPSGTKFNLIITVMNEQMDREILRAMYVFSLLGGIGSRSRNGFGSFDVLNKTEVFKNYSNNIISKIAQGKNATAYPSFCQMTKQFKDKQVSNSALDALANMGKIYKNARLSLEKRHFFDKRQYIGSPIVEKKITKSFLDRHAKPYFIKIAKEENQYRGYILYLPSQYCNGLEKDRNGRPINHLEANNNFTQVCNEFNKFLSQNMETII